MKKHNIPLNLLIPKKIKTKIENGELHVPAEIDNLGKHRHHVDVPGKYRLPFRIGMSAKIKYYKLNQIASQFSLYVNAGVVYFNGGHTSASDVLTGDNVPPDFICCNDILTEEYVSISVMFGSEIMWVAVNGKFCFSSNKMPYIRRIQDNDVVDSIRHGVGISLCGGTATRVSIKEFSVTGYEGDEPEIPTDLLNLPELSGFELFVKGLPSAIQDEMMKMDEFLMKGMMGSLKFRKSINKMGHLTYESACGFRFEIKEYGAGLTFLTAWVKNDKKTDHTNEAIHKLAKTSPNLAKRMFVKVHGCEVHNRGCARTVIYEFMGESKMSCCGRMNIKMDPSGFEDLRSFIAAIGEVINGG